MNKTCNKSILCAFPFLSCAVFSLNKIVKTLALLGGLGIISILAMTVVSILGRNFFGSPILGDFELIGLVSGISAFLFLPYCHQHSSHVQVDLLAQFLPSYIGRSIEFFFAIASFLMTFLFTLGGIESYQSQEYTPILSLPLWISYPFSIFSFFILGIVCLDRSKGRSS